MKLLSNFILWYITVVLFGSVSINVYILQNFFLITDNDDNTKQYKNKRQSTCTHKTKLFCSQVLQSIANEK